jgi:hypothetical protein
MGSNCRKLENAKRKRPPKVSNSPHMINDLLTETVCGFFYVHFYYLFGDYTQSGVEWMALGASQ